MQCYRRCFLLLTLLLVAILPAELLVKLLQDRGGGRLGLVRLSRRRGSRDGFGADRGSGGRCLLRRWGDQLEGEFLPAGGPLLG